MAAVLTGNRAATACIETLLLRPKCRPGGARNSIATCTQFGCIHRTPSRPTGFDHLSPRYAEIVKALGLTNIKTSMRPSYA
jgi:hypothetical protein